jgi:signal transduction histidine kinase/CheY-like chemotaxis protein
VLPRGVFVFLDDTPPGHLADVAAILHRACEAIVSRVENVTLMDELILVNAALDRRVAERTGALAASEARLRLALSAAQMATLEWSPAEDRMDWSEGAEALLGARPTSLAGYLALVAPEDAPAIEAALREAPSSGRRLLVAHRLVGRRDRWLELHASAGGGTLTGVLVDVTERRRLEDDLRQAQRLDSIGRLAGGVAHDFNNLLTTILGVGELLAADLPAGSPAAGDVASILEAGRHAATLTRQLLAFARRQRLETRSLDLGEVVRSFTPMLRRLIGEDVAVELELDARAPAVLGDRAQLEQVIMNLGVNARDAMPEGGRLAIEVAPADPPPGARHGAGRWCRLRVADTGPGMTPEVMANAFEPFFTTKAPGQGTGLGLATVYGIVRQHGGEVRLSSEPGAGLTVEVLLPGVSGQAAEAADGPARRTLPGGRETVLVVDDEPSVRRVLEVVLTRLGYRVLSAAGGEEALRTAEREGEVDLLLTDLIMPGMRGTELARRFRERSPRAAVLFMSGYPGSEPLDPGTRLLAKPLTPEALAAAVRAVLDGQG